MTNTTPDTWTDTPTRWRSPAGARTPVTAGLAASPAAGSSASMPRRLTLPPALLLTQDGVALRMVAWLSWRMQPGAEPARRLCPPWPLAEELGPPASACLARLVRGLGLAALLHPRAAAHRAWQQALQQALAEPLRQHRAVLQTARLSHVGLPPGQQEHHDLALCNALLACRLGHRQAADGPLDPPLSFTTETPP